MKFRRPTHQLVGNFMNAGREWRGKGDPEEVEVYDFLSKALGRAVPDGVYVIARQRRVGQCRDEP